MNTIKFLSFTVLFSFALMFLTSASTYPTSVGKGEGVGKEESVKKQNKKESQIMRLENKISKAKSEAKKQRLQNRIDKISEGNDDTQTLSILALVFAFIFPVVGLILAIIAKKQEGGKLAQIAFILSLVFLILWVLSLVVYIALFAAAFAAI
jgi:Flp pilus assembly protein TadB